MVLRKIFAAAVLLWLGAATLMAQQMPPIPVDSDVRIGKLPLLHPDACIFLR